MTEMNRQLTVPDLNKVKALAILSRAEAALAEATDINDILQLREDGAAFAAMATAKKMGDVAQQAKVFQLRAERKAGDWLVVQPRNRGVRPEDRSSRAPTFEELVDGLGLQRATATRWQVMARIPDRIFSAWVKDCLVEGEEISQRAFLRLAKPTAPPSPPEKPLSLLDQLADAFKEVNRLGHLLGSPTDAKQAREYLGYTRQSISWSKETTIALEGLIKFLEKQSGRKE